MRKTFFAILGLFFCLSFPLHARDSVCGSVQAPLPEIEIIDTKTEITYDFSLTEKELTRLGQLPADILHKGQKYQNRAGVVLTGNHMGLTEGSYQYTLYMWSEFVRAGQSGSYCPKIKKVLIRFMYASKIYVAKEYPYMSCAFKRIMEHEYLHHYTNIDNKQRYLGWLKTDIPMVAHEIVKQYKPVNSKKDMGVTRERLKTDLQNAVDVYVEKMYRDTEKENRMLDTTSEYLKLSRAVKRCYKD